MKRSITRWTTTLATVGMLGLPAGSFAGTTQDPTPQQQQPQPQPAQPQPAQPQPEQPTPEPAQPQPQPAQPNPAQPTYPQPTQPPATAPQQPTTASTPQPTGEQAASPQEHLREAQAALSGITPASVPARNRAALAQIKRHLTALERAAGTESPKAGTARSPKGTTTARANANWGTEVAAIDKLITDIVGSESASTTATTPNPTGTSGTTGTTGARADSKTTLDDATRSKLMEVRKHITAYAAGMSGSATAPKNEASATPESRSMNQPGNPSSTTATTPAPTATPQSTTPQSTTPQSTTPSNPNAPEPNATAPAPSATTPQQDPASQPNPATAQPNATTPQPNATTPQPDATTPQQNPAQTSPDPAQTATAGAAQQADPEAAHRHLTEARNTLSQLTQLPAAAELTGEARTQVSQLIANFNELISAQSNWEASYAKVSANLTSLLGPDNSDNEAMAGAPTTATGATPTTGAVGTSGEATVELDPAIRAKLVELRRKLVEFQKAAGATVK